MTAPVVLEAKSLTKVFPRRQGWLWAGHEVVPPAVNNVSLELHRGRTLGLVGESGSGKSTLARMLLRLEQPTSGTVCLEGHDLYKLDGTELRSARRHLQIIFQDPYSSLTPRMTIGSLLSEAWDIHRDIEPPIGRTARIAELLELVGLQAADARRYPHEFSGGQRQRIAIARALSPGPGILVCDEPVSALDVSIQAQIVNLLRDIQRELGIAYLFISHDLAIVRQMADRVAVMLAGSIVETADSDKLFSSPEHEYTARLLASVTGRESAFAIR